MAGTGEDQGAMNCPLCLMFNTATTRAALAQCVGCPVYAVTGLVGCAGTPHDDWEAADGEDPEIAKCELEFLKSLLPAQQQIGR